MRLSKCLQRQINKCKDIMFSKNYPYREELMKRKSIIKQKLKDIKEELRDG